MKQRFIIVFFIIFFFSCQKEEPSDQQTDSIYYFEATLSDGRNINIKDTYPPSSNSRAFMTALIKPDPVIEAQGGINGCPPLSDCFEWGFGIHGDEEGYYDATGLGLNFKEGVDDYMYTSVTSTDDDPDTPPQHHITMTVSEVERRIPVGSLQGTFSGTVWRVKKTEPNIETPVHISGKFRLPLIK